VLILTVRSLVTNASPPMSARWTARLTLTVWRTPASSVDVKTAKEDQEEEGEEEGEDKENNQELEEKEKDEDGPKEEKYRTKHYSKTRARVNVHRFAYVMYSYCSV